MQPGRARGTVSGGSNRRLAEWFREWRTPLRRFIARRRGVSAADIDDVAQEVFLRLLRYEREELVADPKSYMFKVAANVASEWSMRARQRFPHASNWLDELTDDIDVLSDAARGQRNADLNAALSRLTPRAREVLRLQFAEGLNREQIAKRLNVTHRVVKREIVNAYVLLRMSLGRVADGALPCEVELPAAAADES